jgi:Flp pilus assembly protein TadB
MMNFNDPVLSSTLLLTILSLVGLFFFIRASVKDRIQKIEIISEKSEDYLLEKLRDYFQQRAYQVSAIDGEKNQVTLQGFVKQSVFLAVFLTVLALIGLSCFALVLSILFSSLGSWGFVLVLLSPLAGWFYWQKSGRIETISFKIESLNQTDQVNKVRLIVVGHRDELKILSEQFS